MWRATIGRIVMFRKITIGCAVVVAMLGAPLPAQSMGGMGSMHSMGGMHSSGMASRPGGVHTFSRANFPRHHFAHFAHFHRFHHFRHHFVFFHHFRHRHLFATAIGVGSCWRWVPTRFAWHRV